MRKAWLAITHGPLPRKDPKLRSIAAQGMSATCCCMVIAVTAILAAALQCLLRMLYYLPVLLAYYLAVLIALSRYLTNNASY